MRKESTKPWWIL